MIEITLDKAIEWVKAEVKGREHFVYDSSPGKYCAYIEGHEVDYDEGKPSYITTLAKPSCLVGCALLNHTPVTMQDILTRGLNTEDSGMLLDQLADDGILEYSHEARYFLLSVQRLQDTGHSWSESLNLALRDSES